MDKNFLHNELVTDTWKQLLKVWYYLGFLMRMCVDDTERLHNTGHGQIFAKLLALVLIALKYFNGRKANIST